MDTVMENEHRVAATLKAAWEHCTELFNARSLSAAWQSFRKLVEGLPTWALVLVVALVVWLVVDPWYVIVAGAALAFFPALYFTVKHAVLAAWRERDAELARRDSSSSADSPRA